MGKDDKLHIYIYRMILNDIHNGKYQYQDKLPTLIQLCHQYKVGRNTMRKALNLLKDEEYIELHKGSQAIVCFDLEEFDKNQKYKQDVKNAEKMIQDIFETIALIFPDIAYQSTRLASPEQIKSLSLKFQNYSIDYQKSEAEVFQELHHILLLILSFLKNPTVNDLFSCLFYSMILPLVPQEEVHEDLRKSLKGTRHVFQYIIKHVQSDDFHQLKEIFVGMCQHQAQLTQKYIDMICDDMTVQNETQFVWIGDHQFNFLYSQVVFGIMKDIQDDVYENQQVLPSITKLSEKYNVSDRTIRTALDILRKYKVIETINGIGSKVTIEQFQNETQYSLYKDEIQIFYYAYELIALMSHALMPQIIKLATDNELVNLKNKMKKDKILSLHPLYDYIFSQCNQCLQNIYSELKKPLGWELFIHQIIIQKEYDFQTIKDNLFIALENKNTDQICYCCDQIADVVLKIVKQLIL